MNILLIQIEFFQDTYIYQHIIKIQKEKFQSYHQNHSQGLKNEVLFVSPIFVGEKNIYIIIIKILNHQRLIGTRFKANCLLVGLGPIGRVPSMGVFLKNPSPYLRENHQRKKKSISICM